MGSNVYEFQPGDRVASFHEMMTAAGSFAEYALGEQHTTFHLPKSVSFEGMCAPLRGFLLSVRSEMLIFAC